MSTSAALQKKIADRKVVVGVIGLGYVGLPLVREFCGAGIRVWGFDIDQRKVRMLRAGQTYIEHLPGRFFQDLIKKGRFTPTADMNQLTKPDAILIAVPTPLDKMRDPDMSYIEHTTADIAKRLRPGQLIVLESTTYPGTTREVCQPMLDATGLKLDRDYFLAFSPEREDPGRADMTTKQIPKVVGGVTATSGKLAAAVYALALDRVVPVSTADIAEACKIVENVYRCVNIALVNELKMLFDRMGIDVWEVINAAKTKPFGFQAFYPGPGLGGHCIPIDPFYLSWKAREFNTTTRFIELAGEINTGMPEYVVRRVADALNDRGKAVKGSKVLVLGLAYKPNVDDDRESPSYALLDLLKHRGAEVAYYDPFVPVIKHTREHPHFAGTKSVAWDRAIIAGFDVVLIATNHASVNYQELAAWAPCIVDARNAMAGIATKPGQVTKA